MTHLVTPEEGRGAAPLLPWEFKKNVARASGCMQKELCRGSTGRNIQFWLQVLHSDRSHFGDRKTPSARPQVSQGVPCRTAWPLFQKGFYSKKDLVYHVNYTIMVMYTQKISQQLPKINECEL